jgi:hypothetical protein
MVLTTPSQHFTSVSSHSYMPVKNLREEYLRAFCVNDSSLRGFHVTPLDTDSN